LGIESSGVPSAIRSFHWTKAAMDSSNGAPWTPDEDALLGTMPDRKLARRLGRTYNAVAARRLNKSIPYCNPKRKSWRPQDDEVLGTRPDDQVALLLRRTVASKKIAAANSAFARHVPNWFVHGQWGEDRLLGTTPDAALAHQFRRTLLSVRERRRRLKIQATPLENG
jgi:hypothetical protein